MRSIYAAAAVLAAFLVPAAQADAAELYLLTPAFVYNAGLKDLAASFEKETGVKVTLKSVGMGGVMNTINTGMPAPDLVIIPIEPYDFMGNLALSGGVVPGTFTPLGRVEIGLAVKAGVAHPDISTTDKLIAVLKASKGVIYSNPFPEGRSMEATVIDHLLNRPEFAGIHRIITKRGDGAQGLAHEGTEADMTLQLVCEILDLPDVSLVGPLPPELGAHIDGAIAVSKRSADVKDAKAFIAYVTRPEAAAVWKAKGLDRF